MRPAAAAAAAAAAASQGVDIQPEISQINTDIRGFRGFPAPPPGPPNSLDDVTLAVGGASSGIAGGRR
jgi:hypothetical protein